MRISWCEAKHTPYISRRGFEIQVNDVSKEDILGLAILQEHHREDEYEEYIKSFCIQCKEAEGKCFRHHTLTDAVFSLFGPPTGEREVELSFSVKDKDKVTLKNLLIRFTAWEITGDSDKIIISRPSGLTYRYNNHNGESSYWHFLKLFAKLLWEQLPYALLSSVEAD